MSWNTPAFAYNPKVKWRKNGFRAAESHVAFPTYQRKYISKCISVIHQFMRLVTSHKNPR